MRPMCGKKSASPAPGGASAKAGVSAQGRSGVIRVLYDGWALAHAPSTPGALHLLALLSALPAGIEALVALPVSSAAALPPGVTAIHLPGKESTLARLAWEQRALPRLAREHGAQILHLFGLHPPLACPVPVVVSPAEVAERAEGDAAPLGLRQVGARLRGALAAGAADSIGAIFWPDDLEPPATKSAVLRLPPLPHPAFQRPTTTFFHPDAEGCVLYHGALEETTLLRLLEGWGWVAGALGAFNPLVLAGLNAEQAALAARLAQAGDFGDSVRVLSARSPEDWAALYAAASLVVHLGAPAAWGDALTNALAAGKPLVAWEHPLTAQRVGPAAYLTPPGDGRALGAAISTLMVETEMAENLAARARERATAWSSQSFGARLLDLYRRTTAR